jgi:hypothetical protein
VELSGSSYTDSYNAENGPYFPGTAGQAGHVCSNYELKLSGSSAIYGDAHWGKDGKLSDSSSIGITGTKGPLTEDLSFPPIDPGNAATANDNALIPLSVGGKDPVNSNGEFVLSGGDHVDVPPGTYYFSKLTLSGGSTAGISGPTVIYVTNKIAISGGSLANTTMLPKNLQLYSMGSECAISGDSDFYGVVYGPTSKVVRSSDADFYGAIVGLQVTLSGSGGVHADVSLETEFLDTGPGGGELVQ